MSEGETAVNRRDFVKGAVAAGVTLGTAGRLWPQSGTKLPSGKVIGANDRINVAAIGVGGRGAGNVMGCFVPLKDVRLVAACDCYKSRREGFAAQVNKKYGSEVCIPSADFREVLARADVDAVVISTADHWHVPLAYHAAAAKKDMYVEKPLSVAMAWSWKLRDLCARNQVVFQYGTQQRSSGGFRRAVNLVRNGYIGKIQRVDAWSPDMSTQFNCAKVPPYGSTQEETPPPDLNFDMWIGPAPMKPYTPDRCTCFGGYHIRDYALGFIAGWGVHPLDIAQWGLDADNTSPVSYKGEGKIPPAGSLWDTVESWDVTSTYANGVEVRNMGSRVAQPVVSKMERRPWCDHGTTFFGADGWVSVDRGGCYMNLKGKSVNASKFETKPDDPTVYVSDSHARNFIDCVKSRKPTISPLDAAIRCDTISHLGDMAIRLGRTIKWDPAKEQIIDDAEAAKMLDRPLRAPYTM